ncbi:unnamed protein product [Polarella glacialis]|uniref:Poly [ADP-ribose] polymerase n=1 Tax=Polarella glacialis TaxID=89957 RepID=A0A813J079_POLGL|nr:unnamed protein product [Polarella glacialis]
MNGNAFLQKIAAQARAMAAGDEDDGVGRYEEEEAPQQPSLQELWGRDPSPEGQHPLDVNQAAASASQHGESVTTTISWIAMLPQLCFLRPLMQARAASEEDVWADAEQNLEATSPELRGRLQGLLNSTFLPRRSCDRRGPMPQVLRLKKAFRAQAVGPVWSEFAAELDTLRWALPDGCAALEPPPRTAAFQVEMDSGPNLNQFYLFHGTSPQDAVSIASTGFDLDRSGSLKAASSGKKKGRMFNTGVYLADCASKADEYASESSGRKSGGKSKGGIFAMLLCRVLLGRVLRVTRAVGGAGADPGLAGTLRTASCDTLLGDLEESCGTYKEFIIPETAKVFPEFVIGYQRLYGPPAGPWSTIPPRKSLR